MAFGFKHGSKYLIKFIDKPVVTGAYTFDNSAKTAVISGYDSKAMTMSGTQSATSAGSYTLKFVLNRGYMWSDRSQADVSRTWTIAKRSIAVPTMTNKSFTYAVNSTFAPTISGVNSYITQTGTASASVAGSYSVVWALKYPNDTLWSDNTTANKSASWTIAKRSITIPTLTNASYTWETGKTYAPTVNNFSSTYSTQSGTVSSSNAGSWTVTWALSDTTNTVWSDNTVTNKTATWSVAKRTISVPSMTNTSYTWETGKTFKPTITGVDTTYVTQSGVVSSTSAGSWTVTWTLKSTANTQWSGGTTASKTASWSVAKRTITVPTLTNGSKTWAVNTTFKPTISGVDANYVTQSGVVSSTSVGSWTVTWALKDKNNSVWSGNTTTDKTASWSVAKRVITIPTMTSTSYTWETGKTFKPTISAIDTNYITQSGTVSSKNAGSWTVTWKLNDTSNSIWKDNTVTNKTASWSVAKRSITVPTMTNTSYTWDVNMTYKPTISGVDATYVTQTGTTSSTSAGSWTVTWALNDKSNTIWNDGGTDNKTATWTVAKKTLTVPSISGTKSFAFVEGTSRSVTVSNFSSTYETQSGNTSASALGTYTLTWTLRYPANTQWSGGTTSNKTATWEIKWVNGTSHYANDYYNKGWSSGKIELRYSEDSTHGVITWNSDNFTLQSNEMRLTDQFQKKTFHARVKLVVTSGSVTSSNANIYEFKDDWGRTSAKNITGSIISSYSEISGYIEGDTVYYRKIGMVVFGGKGTTSTNKYHLMFERIWIT